MIVGRLGRGVEVVELDERVSVEDLVAETDQGGWEWTVASSEPGPEGAVALVLDKRWLVLRREDIDELILALLDRRERVWGPDVGE